MQLRLPLRSTARSVVAAIAVLLVVAPTGGSHGESQDGGADASSESESVSPEAAAVALLDQEAATCSTSLLQMGAATRPGTGEGAPGEGRRSPIRAWFLAPPPGANNQTQHHLFPRLPSTIMHLDDGMEAEEVHSFAKNGVLPASGVFMFSLLFGRFVGSFKRTSFIPETLCTLMVAGVLGSIVRNMMTLGWVSKVEVETVDATSLNLIMLPMIVFNGGWSINHQLFKKQFLYIQIFAIVGTVVTMLVIFASSISLARLGVHAVTGVRANLAMAALISATDPVSTLATYGKLKVAKGQPLLHILVSGEALLNDVVAIAVFSAVNTPGAETFHAGFARHMAQLFFGSILVGFGVSASLVLLKRSVNLEGDSILEVLFMFISPFFIYSLAESLELSGIIATLFAGMAFRIYGAQHLTQAEEEKATTFFETVATFMETCVFILCGTSTALIRSLKGFKYGLTVVGLCFFSRAVAVGFCVAFSNMIKTLTDEPAPARICKRQAFMIWLSGQRGGVALVLALMIDPGWCGGQTKTVIVNATFTVICLMLLFCGGSTEICLKALGLVPAGGGEDLDEAERLKLEWFYEKGESGFMSRLHAFLESILVGQAAKERRNPVQGRRVSTPS